MSTPHNDTEKRILAAAEQEFMLKGYGGARTTAIAERAGVTHTMLHYYYRTKESLFDKIIEEKANELLGQMMSLCPAEDNRLITDKMCDVVERHFDLLVENPLLPGFVISELRSNPERLNGWFSKISDAVTSLAGPLQQELDRSAARGATCHISVILLLTDIMSLNISSVSFADVLCRMYGIGKEEYLALRRKENVEVIRKRLTP